MRFLLMGDWPNARFVVPAGTTIDGDDPQYLAETLPMPPPLNAKALDQAALDYMVAAYIPLMGEDCLRLLQHAPGLTLKGPNG